MVEALPTVLASVLDGLRPQLDALASAGLPDAWLGAGVIRNPVWDRLFGTPAQPTADWDVAFVGGLSNAEATARLVACLAGPWEAVDQAAYGHVTAAEGIASWPETATAVGARLTANGELEVTAPWGLGDLLSGRVRRTPSFTDVDAFHARQRAKRWAERWPGLVVAPLVTGAPLRNSARLPFSDQLSGSAPAPDGAT